MKMTLKWKQLKFENDSKSDDNPKDEEDLKIKTTSKMRMISKIENDPKINDNPHKKWGRPQNVNNSKTYGHTICCFALFFDMIW